MEPVSPDEGGPRHAGMRASDADRDRTIEALNGAVEIGQLKPDEHESRVQAALDATTLDQLSALTADLSTPPTAVGRRRRWPAGVAVVIAAIASLIGLLVADTGTTGQAPSSTPSSSLAPSPVPGGPTASGPATTLPTVVTSPQSPTLDGLSIAVVPPGDFAAYDPADVCGPFGAQYSGGGQNCYIVVQFTNNTSSSLLVVPVDVRMVDQTGDTYRVEPVAPPCYNSIDVNAPQSVPPHGHVSAQLCYPVMTGALPETLVGTGALQGLSLNVPADSVRGTWGGE